MRLQDPRGPDRCSPAAPGPCFSLPSKFLQEEEEDEEEEEEEEEKQEEEEDGLGGRRGGGGGFALGLRGGNE
ncbi:hypothetical protein E2C01_089777 [Portunus trituberculatus]|uniref:Uncharacterized protein n=1 Tax=Portunus trituberculatus TaxID=210409 RepID=A0A5B7JCY3_PORTR|nr:hypothetical protein [Portunus trituberculatus]